MTTHTWQVRESEFNPAKLHHSETVFTIGNGYLGTRGAFEEKYPGEMRATFLHGVFDDVPVVFTELANTPDWLEMEILLDGERFSLSTGKLLAYNRVLDLGSATLTRDLRWQSPSGKVTHLVFERFASLANQHICAVRATITPQNYSGRVEVRAGLDGEVDNLAYKHWDWLAQDVKKQTAWLHSRTRSSKVELVTALSLNLSAPGKPARTSAWDVRNHPTLVCSIQLDAGQSGSALKLFSQYTSRDMPKPLRQTRLTLAHAVRQGWSALAEAHRAAWDKEWQRCDVLIEGDDEAQLALRFNLFQLLAAAPRHDERVNIGAKTLSGYGYRGHAFWDTEIFMLPFFTYTRPEIARNLLSYRWHNLPGAFAKATGNKFQGAQYPWESAATGEEVTPTWVPDGANRTKLIRIWTGDIEVHISADVSYGVWQYYQATGDLPFLLERGAEIILQTARFWASRVEWNAGLRRYEINDIVGPDEYHDHVDNNIYTNWLARWNLQTALHLQTWLSTEHTQAWRKLNRRVALKSPELKQWQFIIDNIYLPFDPQSRLYEQFEGYFQRSDVNFADYEPRTLSMQQIFGIEGVCQTQVIKQPDVLMLMYMLPEYFNEETVRVNYDYYTPRTDHTLGSSLGPSIQAIMACKMGDPAAYEHFMRAARADLFDVRGNAGDGIHGASAGGLWQAVVFGFAGLQRSATGSWQAHPRLPQGWKRIQFKIMEQGVERVFDVKADA